MNPEIQIIWNEILGDISTPVAFWQLFIVTACLGVSWAVNGALKVYFNQYSRENTKLVFGSVNRILFPITAYLLVSLAKAILVNWMHVGILLLASKLLLAMAVIRLTVYGLRYIFSPSGWLKTLEQFIAWSIWIVLALHLS
jgi:flagellar biosynthesis protein FlhB